MVGPSLSIGGGFWRMQQILHMLRSIVVEEGSVMQKAIFAKILRVATNFFVTDYVIIFPHLKSKRLKKLPNKTLRST